MNDYGHEPWARANVRRGFHSTPEQVAELLESLDAARRALVQAHADREVRDGDWQDQLDHANAQVAALRDLDVEVGRFLSVVDHRVRAGWTKLPPREVDRLRAVHQAASEGAPSGVAS